VVIVILLAVVWSRSFAAAAFQWERAGDMAESLRRELRERPEASRASRLVFFCVPDFHGTAALYVTYFEKDVADTLGGAPTVVRRRDGEQLSAREAAATLQPGDVAYRWDPQIHRLERLSPSLTTGGSPNAPVCRPATDVVRP
jgi:hypothetical protein